MQKMGSAIVLIIIGLVVLAFPLLGVVPAAVITGFLVLIFGLGLLFGGISEMGESAGLGILEIILGIIALVLGIGFIFNPGLFAFLAGLLIWIIGIFIVIVGLIGGVFIAMMTGTAFIVGALSNVYFMQTSGQLAIQAAGNNADKIIPLFISAAMPLWFAYLFMITLLSAAMSTLSAQFHVQGTALGRDIYETLANKTGGSSVMVARAGIVVAVFIAVILGFVLPANIAVGTAMWFSLTAVAFLAMYVCALFWKRTTKEGAIVGLVAGTVFTAFCYLFANQKSSRSPWSVQGFDW